MQHPIKLKNVLKKYLFFAQDHPESIALEYSLGKYNNTKITCYKTELFSSIMIILKFCSWSENSLGYVPNAGTGKGVVITI